MNTKFGWSLIFVGIALLLAGISLWFVGAEILNIPFVRMDLVPIAVGFCGTLLLIIGGSAIGEEKYKTKEQQIEDKDERIIKIKQKSKSKAYDLMATLLPFTLLALAMFGYMNKVSFLLLVGVYFVCIGYLSYQLYKNKAEM